MAARISQHVIEVATISTKPPVLVSQIAAQAMRRAVSPFVVVSQIAVQTLRRLPTPPTRIRPFKHPNRITDNSNGVRIFPV